MKYKVGDKVKVRKDFKTCDTYGGYLAVCCWAAGMAWESNI